MSPLVWFVGSALVLVSAQKSHAERLADPPGWASTSTVTQSTNERVLSIAFYIRTKKGGGKVRCGLYNHDKDWLTSRYVFRATSDIRDRKAVCLFYNVPPGTYAASAYHDQNNNGDLDKNFLGLPKEDFAFSSGAKARLGPPSFADASFRYEGGRKRVSGNM